MTTSALQSNPNEVLAKLVLDTLKENDHIPAGKDNEILKKLVGGTATQQDWRLWVDLAQAKPVQVES